MPRLEYFRGVSYLYFSERAELPGDDPEKGGTNQLIRLLAVAAFLILSVFAGAQENIPETSWPIFLRLMLQTGEVERLDVASAQEKVYVYLHNGAIINGREAFGHGPHYSFTIGNLKTFEERLIKAQEELGINSKDFIPIKFYPPDSGVM